MGHNKETTDWDTKKPEDRLGYLYDNTKTAVDDYRDNLVRYKYTAAEKLVRPVVESMYFSFCADHNQDPTHAGGGSEDSGGSNKADHYGRFLHLAKKDATFTDKYLQAARNLQPYVNPLSHAKYTEKLTQELAKKNLKPVHDSLRILCDWYFKKSGLSMRFGKWKHELPDLDSKMGYYVAGSLVLVVVLLLVFAPSSKNGTAEQQDPEGSTVGASAAQAVSDAATPIAQPPADQLAAVTGAASTGEATAATQVVREAPSFGAASSGGRAAPGPINYGVRGAQLEEAYHAARNLRNWFRSYGIDREAYYGAMDFPMECYYRKSGVTRERIAASRDKAFDAGRTRPLVEATWPIRVAWLRNDEAALVVGHPEESPETGAAAKSKLKGVLMKKRDGEWRVAAEVTPDLNGPADATCLPGVFDAVVGRDPIPNR